MKTICILCLRRDGGETGREHVLEAHFGARWRLPPGVVCDRCNSATSVLDGDLRKYVSAVLAREPSPTILGGGPAVVQIDGRWWATRIGDRDFARYLPPQLVLPMDGGREPALLWAETPTEAAALQRELASGVHVEVQPIAELRHALVDRQILVRSRPGYYALWCAPTDALAIAEGLRGGRQTVENVTIVEGLLQRLEEDGGTFRAVVPVNVRHVHRALAKVALNFVAHTLGPSIARSRLWVRARDFVLNDKSWADCIISMEKLKELGRPDASPGRLVAEHVFERVDDEAAGLGDVAVQPAKHVLALGATSKGIFFFMSLDGEPFAYVPLLAQLPGVDLRGVLGAAVVDPAGATGDEIGRLRWLKRVRVRALLRACGELLPRHKVLPPSPIFVRSEPTRLVYEATYARHPRLGPRPTEDRRPKSNSTA